MFLHLEFTAVAALCLFGTAAADVPQLINYQGTLPPLACSPFLVSFNATEH